MDVSCVHAQRDRRLEHKARNQFGMNGIIKSVVSMGNPNKTRHLVFIIEVEWRRESCHLR